MGKIWGSFKRKYLIKYEFRYLSYIVIFNFFAYYGARLLTGSRVHHDISLSFERYIPFVPKMIIVYWGCYLFWIVLYIFIIYQEQTEAKLFMVSELLGKAMCFFIFMIFPTTMVRAEVTGTGLWNQAMRLLYSVDAPDNLFPSIHCYVSWMCFLGVKDMKKLSVIGKAVVLFIALLICLSTLMVKQHVIYDVIGGIFIAEFSYRIVHRKRGVLN